ncbi:hypothetical protein K2173_019022 [Erythroxylum novogranatense]|uniref:HSF-type DNA-binding domain-containing protein n=1 Tax=Erythroxylum novogranatense TaxID=1862640 RepID=A0AAV8ST86_9ROSI|nr:hypothetical protein K2173_019022 [Erythroxylum novogranatense]
MEAGGGGGGGGPAPFLLKTYDMVDDSSTDEIVSWSSAKNSFVVWNPPDFAQLLLPTYFKHNNFSSFIRQLNTYGFRKIDPEKWEFANEDFVKDQKHLLKNIHRRKPIHSHSNPQGSSLDPERAAFEEKIEKLAQEKAALEKRIWRFEQQRSAAKTQLEELTQKLSGMEHRQETLLSFFEKAVHDPAFLEHLARKVEPLDFTAYNKKRRLPQVDQSKPTVESSFMENHCGSRPELGNVINQDFSNKLRLELTPAVSDVNLLSLSTQSSNEDGESSSRKMSEEDPKDAQPRTSGLLFATEMLELSDTGASYAFKGNSAFSRKVAANESPGMHSVQQNSTSNEDIDGPISCHLNLTLASSSLQLNRSSYSAKTPQLGQVIGKSVESSFDGNDKEADIVNNPRERDQGVENANLSSWQEAAVNNQGPAAAPVRVNDLFWEQFLTERPGASDNEEAISNYRAHAYDEQEDRRSRDVKNMEGLSL